MAFFNFVFADILLIQVPGNNDVDQEQCKLISYLSCIIHITDEIKKRVSQMLLHL